MERRITYAMVSRFAQRLCAEEKSGNTVEKYLRDVRGFCCYAAAREVDKTLVLAYKAMLQEKYAATSSNSVIAAVNAFLRFLGWTDCCIKQLRIQKKTFCREEKELTKEEYVRLVHAAQRQGNQRLELILQTLCATGIRVSELQFITVEAARRGEAVVSCKSKTRSVFLVRQLQKKLLQYSKRQGITAGCIFVTRSGKPMSRCNIWREMKALCAQAGVAPGKVFPHNLRHLFARTFYHLEKDLAKLADILGHSSINTTRLYIITTGAEHKRQMETMRLTI